MKKLVALVFALVCVLGLLGCSSESASVSIIGGADGPTARFVTSTIIWQSIFGLVAVIIVTIVIAVIIYLNKKKK